MIFNFGPKIIAEAESKYSGKIRVVQGWGFRHLSTDTIQHSGGIVEEIWSSAMKDHVKKDASWLMLGVAGGCVLKLISKKYQPKRMVGVEIDPVIIELGKKYFGLEEIPHLEIVIEDAEKYVFKNREKFDYVLGDLFGTESPPDFIYDKKFIERLKEIGDKVYINHLYNNAKNIAAAAKLEKTIKNSGLAYHKKRVLNNIVIDF